MKVDFELLIEEKQVSIIDNNLPVVIGNYIQLGQLFSNLISNALKFLRENLQVEISCKVITSEEIKNSPITLLEQKYYQIAFKDNGIGFEQEYGKLIFSLFQRLHSKQSNYQGTAIGLALCKKIVENHKGFISAEGTPGAGSVFTVYLPIA